MTYSETIIKHMFPVTMWITKKTEGINWQLHIHTLFTHLHKFTGDDLPTCHTCSLPLTIKHILVVDCLNLDTIWHTFFKVSSLMDRFESIYNHVIIDFIKEICCITLYCVCYHCFISVELPWFPFLILSFFSFLICVPFNGTEMAAFYSYVLSGN